MKFINEDNKKLLFEEKYLSSKHLEYCKLGLNLNLTRGKPSTEQLNLSNKIDGILDGNMIGEDGTDLRNYGGDCGIPEARNLGAQLLGLNDNEIICSDNSSLSLMYLYILHAYYHGFENQESAWIKEGDIKFICLVPGYDRHFQICEELGIKMINVPFLSKDPDIDRIEKLLKSDPLIKGIWCVPKYSNPTGHVYSDNVIKRFAKLAKISGKNFRIMWDNAYSVRDLFDNSPNMINIMDEAKKVGSEDSIVITGSTSKITFAGGGISFIGSSLKNIKNFRKRISTMTIGPDKLNQRRHVLFLKNLEGIKNLMKKHAKIISPKFLLVTKKLEKELTSDEMGTWSNPRGGYFICFYAPKGTASEIIKVSAEAGVELTPAGSPFPYNNDFDDTVIRIAPTFPTLSDLKKAMDVFVNSVKLVCVRRKINNSH